MDLKEARERFIEAWGAFGSAWGINRSMAQVHALLASDTSGLEGLAASGAQSLGSAKAA